VICDPKIITFIGLNHELVNNHYIFIWHPLARLQAEPHGYAPLFSHLHEPSELGHTVDAIWNAGARNIDVALLHQLEVLFKGQNDTEKLASSLLRLSVGAIMAKDEHRYYQGRYHYSQ